MLYLSVTLRGVNPKILHTQNWRWLSQVSPKHRYVATRIHETPLPIKWEAWRAWKRWRSKIYCPFQ